MIYLLHFERRVSGHAGHYMGSCGDSLEALRRRLGEHRAGGGARLTAAAAAQGIAFWLVRTFPGGRREERRRKGRPSGSSHLARLCPLCGRSPAAAARYPAVRL